MSDRRNINEGWQPGKFGYQPKMEERGYQISQNSNKQPSDPPNVNSSVQSHGTSDNQSNGSTKPKE